MNQMEIIQRMMQRDTGAFMEMTEKYSWPVYSRIRGTVSDAEQADRLFHKTMDGFYRSLHESESKDPVEAMLFMYADKVMLEEGKGIPSIRHHGKPARSFERGKNRNEVKERGGFVHGMVTFLLLAAIAVVLWVIAGLLMDMNLIPSYDLGYTWAEAYLGQWF